MDYLQQGSTINAKYYCALLMKLRQNIKEKRRGKLSKGVILLHDNASSHIAGETMAKLTSLGFQVMPHQPYSPDLAPSDYYLFPKLKKHLKGRFWSVLEATNAANEWLHQQSEEFYLQDRCRKCIDFLGEYGE